ncbi:DUF1254 domain-containing protein [Bdellovibrio sp. HCB209]|uniref:DUF1254 domain-containing protein n=1 Tax=Bdellovibrio sp. HCB209 TaxID=3394354 RepID=UPI0039B63632
MLKHAVSLLLIVAGCGAFAKDKKSPSVIQSNGFPVEKSAQSVLDEQDYQRALMAYRFWYPTVSAEGIFQGSRNLGAVDNESMFIIAAQPHHVGLTLNSDTPYGGANMDLSAGPVVVDVPPGSFVGLVNDHNQKWILDFGLPGPNKGKGGKHLILPPNYKGNIPQGYQVGRSATNKILVAIRSLPIDGDLKKAMAEMQKVKIYLLNSPNKQMAMFDVTERKSDISLLTWEDNMKFWTSLHKVISEEPLNPEQMAMYGILDNLGIAKGKEFKPDARMKAILERAAKDGKEQMIVTAFGDKRPERITWKDRKWEWAGYISDNGDFMTGSGIDMQARDRWFAQAIVASPAMFSRNPGAGSLYWLGLRDSKGQYLDGGKSYQLKVPYPVPGKLFWSVTAYDAKTRSQVQASQNRAALRSLFELKDIPKDSTEVTLYFGPTAPAGKENYWIQTVPGRGWFTYFRIYGPTEPAFNGSWRPGDFEPATFPKGPGKIGLNH